MGHGKKNARKNTDAGNAAMKRALQNRNFSSSSSSSFSSSSSSSSQRNTSKYSPSKKPTKSSSYSPFSSSSSTSSTSISSSSSSSLYGTSAPGIRGMRNVGNTCYMNSVLQCLSNTKPLTDYIFNMPSTDINRHNPNGARGRFIKAYQHLMTDMWSKSNKSDALDMWTFKSCVSALDSRFKGSRQQDAQELLNWMIDMIHEETNHKMNHKMLKPLTSTVSSSSSSSSTSTSTSLFTAPPLDHFMASSDHPSEIAWQKYLQSNNSTCARTFYGQLMSSLTCPDCHHNEINYETMLSLSVPIPPKQVHVRVQVLCGDTLMFEDVTFDLPQDATVFDLRTRIHEHEMDQKKIQKTKKQKTNDFHVDLPLDLPSPQISTPSCHDTFGFYPSTFIQDKDKRPYSTYEKDILVTDVIATHPGTLCCYSRVVRGGIRTSSAGELQPSMNNQNNQIVVSIHHFNPSCQKGMGATIMTMFDDRTKILDLGQYLMKHLPSLVVKKDVLNTNSNSYVLEYSIQSSDDGSVSNTIMNTEYQPLSNLHGERSIREVLSGQNRPDRLNIRVVWATNISLRSQGMESLMQPDPSPNISLNDCIKTYCTQETLTDSERWECSACHKRVCAEKKLSISKTPDILIIHLKRFRVDQSSYGRIETVKNHEKVVFPCGMEELNLKPFLAPGVDDAFVSENIRSTKYNLYAVAQHHGQTMRFGHYTAVAQNQLTKQWTKFNDSYTDNIRKENVYSKVVNSNAYVLFYQRQGMSVQTNEMYNIGGSGGGSSSGGVGEQVSV